MLLFWWMDCLGLIVNRPGSFRHVCMLTLIKHNLMKGWFVSRVEPFSRPRIGAIGRVTRSYPEGAASPDTTDGAALVDVQRHQAIHNAALAHGVAIGGKQREHRLGWGRLAFCLGACWRPGIAWGRGGIPTCSNLYTWCIMAIYGHPSDMRP